MQDMWVQFLGWEDPLEEKMATHSSILAWKIPWTEETSGLQSMGQQRAGHNLVTEHTCTWTMYVVHRAGKNKHYQRRAGKERFGSRDAINFCYKSCHFEKNYWLSSDKDHTQALTIGEVVFRSNNAGFVAEF